MPVVFPRKLRVLSDSIALSCRALFSGADAVSPPRMELLEHRRLMSTYYVSNSGSDSNSGTSPSSPWATTARASSATLQPGDSLLFNGGQTFSGQLSIDAVDSGSVSAPVTVGSYGTGRGRLFNGSGRGILVMNAQYINIHNLVINGAGPTSASTYGIKIDNNLGGNATTNHVYVDNMDISGFSYDGIYVFSEKSGSYYNDIRITNCTVHNNAENGITTGSAAMFGIKNVYIAHCDVYENPGNGTDALNSSGSGILVTGTIGGTVEYCEAHENGRTGSGNAGIWAADCTQLVFQYNEVYDNFTAGPRDGDGFDFDINTSYSIMQYNYVHDNDGNGLQLNNWMDNSNSSHNVIRYNIAVNNGRKHNYAGLEVWGKVLDSTIYNNVVFVSPFAGASPSGIKVHNSTISTLFVNNVQFLNNIIVTTGSQPAVNVFSGELGGAKGMVFSGNDYYAANGALSLSYGGKNYTTLAAWQSATGQEKLAGKAVGFSVNPQLVAAGADPTFSDAMKIGTLNSYKLQSTSPLIQKSVAIPGLGVAVAKMDYFSQALPASLIDVGADQTNGKVVTPPSNTPGAPWSQADIGAVGHAGSASVTSAGVYTLTGSGWDIYGTADALQYNYQTLSGDGQIIARVSSLQAANVWSKAGVMIRDSNGAGAKQVSMLVSANGKAEFERRWATNGDTGTTDVTAVAPQWLKLVRSGNNFSGYISSNGTTWTLVGTTVVAMNTNVEIGLAVTSHDVTKVESANFSNVSVMT